MARPLRIEYAGALYHVTARGNARANIYANDDDRQRFLSLLKIVVDRYDWYCHVYCLMDNHYHLLIETNRASLSDGMKLLNGSYTQYPRNGDWTGSSVHFSASLARRDDDGTSMFIGGVTKSRGAEKCAIEFVALLPKWWTTKTS